jgi:ABC-type transport system involved in multi-copper enzyme maturation permease subunit
VVLESPLDPLSVWLPGALAAWAWVAFWLFLLAAAMALVAGVRRRGPTEGVRHWVDLWIGAWVDWKNTSPRRVWALAMLAVRESVRNRIVVALAIFAALLMFAGWFLAGGEDPAKLFIESIFQWTAVLVALVALLVAVFSLPNDIKHRTIYTVVTKPVRAHEIVLGRVIGFSLVALALLGAMAGCGFVFVGRMLDHHHAVDPVGFQDFDLPPAGGKFDANTLVESGLLASAGDHHHRFSLTAAGLGVAETAAGHWHLVTKVVTPKIAGARVDPGDTTRVLVRFTEPMDPVAAAQSENYSVAGGIAVRSARISADNRTATLVLAAPARVNQTQITVSARVKSRLGRELASTDAVAVSDREPPRDLSVYEVGPPEDLLRARVPAYGKLRFTNEDGQERTRGISVGSEWAYRSYVEGATQAAAIWKFDGVTPDRFGDYLQLELTVRVFRTHKGRIDQTTRGTIQFRNPDDPRVITQPREFSSQDGPIVPQVFARRLRGTNAAGEAADLDLFDDVAPQGRLEVVVKCSEAEQFFGVAQADAYLLAREASFAWNYIKATLALLLPIVLVIAIAVTASTVLSSAVALLATSVLLVCGLFADFVARLASNQLHGGGPLEAAYRLQNRMNLMQKLDPGAPKTMIEFGDGAIRATLSGVSRVLPDLTSFWRVDYLAAGFYIPDSHVAILAIKTLGYVVPLVFAGYLLLKTREVAA